MGDHSSTLENRNGIQDAIYNIILVVEEPIVHIKNWERESFEKIIKRYPKPISSSIKDNSVGIKQMIFKPLLDCYHTNDLPQELFLDIEMVVDLNNASTNNIKDHKNPWITAKLQTTLPNGFKNPNLNQLKV